MPPKKSSAHPAIPILGNSYVHCRSPRKPSRPLLGRLYSGAREKKEKKEKEEGGAQQLVSVQAWLLVIEPICQWSSTQTDAIKPCRDFTPALTSPRRANRLKFSVHTFWIGRLTTTGWRYTL